MSDERKGVEHAKLFTEKGFDNIYLLSGGFESFAEHFPNLLEGKQAHIYQAKFGVKPKETATKLSPKKDEIKGTVIIGGKKTDIEKAAVTGKITDGDKSSKGKTGEHIKPAVTSKVTEANPPAGPEPVSMQAKQEINI